MRFIVLAALLSLISCGPKPTTLEDFPTRPITLPGGQVISVETMINDFEVVRGMMFRTSLASDRGMLFVHPKPEHYTYWMYQTLIPLDIIWLIRIATSWKWSPMPSLARRRPASAHSTAESRFRPTCSRSLVEWRENSDCSSVRVSNSDVRADACYPQVDMDSDQLRALLEQVSQAQ